MAIGLLLVHLGVHRGDTAASLLIAAIIFTAAGKLIWDNATVLMDPDATVAAELAARAAIAALDADVELRRLRLRESGGRYFADTVVAVPPGQPLVASHAIADEVEAAIHSALPDSDVVVHLEPQHHGDLRDRVLEAALEHPLVREAHDITIFDHPEGALVSLHLKLAADLSLSDAHAVSERVERTIRADPEVRDVQTHLEPLERPLAVDADAPIDERTRERFARLVRERTDEEPLELRLLRTAAGLVVFVSVATGGPGVSLTEAHTLASRLEDDIRAAEPAVADVVVHTEPGPSA